jgi:hypothetical protein
MDLSLATPKLRPRCSEIQSLTSSSTKVGDEGYSPSPNTGIDEDEGYSPSPGSVSILCDQNSLFLFQSFLRPESSAPVSALFAGPLCPHHASFLAFLNKIVWGSNSPICGQVRKPYRWAVCPIPSLTLEEAFPPTILTGIHSWVRGLF